MKDEQRIKIRQQLRQARRAQDITLRGLAKQLNVSASHLCDIEKGNRHPSTELAEKLKQFFPEVEIEKLVMPSLTERIAELEAENQRLREANPWIPVTERLPEVKNTYEITCKLVNGKVTTAYLWFDGAGFASEPSEIIAWREMPEPYQGDV